MQQLCSTPWILMWRKWAAIHFSHSVKMSVSVCPSAPSIKAECIFASSIQSSFISFNYCLYFLFFWTDYFLPMQRYCRFSTDISFPVVWLRESWHGTQCRVVPPWGNTNRSEPWVGEPRSQRERLSKCKETESRGDGGNRGAKKKDYHQEKQNERLSEWKF